MLSVDFGERWPPELVGYSHFILFMGFSLDLLFLFPFFNLICNVSVMSLEIIAN